MSYMKQPEPEVLDLIVRSGSNDRNVALAAQAELAKALQTPLREAVLVGDIASDIFERQVLPPGANTEWPLDLLNPGQEDDFVAYTYPGNGRIPERHVEGDYVRVPTYMVASSIDYKRSYARDANYNVVQRAMQVLEASMVKKMNDDGWHTILGATADRNLLVFDADASAGQFTKRLLSLMKVVMQRHGGGNTASINRARLTDVYFSPESLEDIRNWGVDQIDEVTRRELFTAPDGSITRVFQVNLHDLVELGENQEYQDYFTTTLGGSLASGDQELVVGLDLSANDSFVMPIREESEVFSDPTFHRQGRISWYTQAEIGLACLDNRRVVAASY